MSFLNYKDFEVKLGEADLPSYAGKAAYTRFAMKEMGAFIATFFCELHFSFQIRQNLEIKTTHSKGKAILASKWTSPALNSLIMLCLYSYILVEVKIGVIQLVQLRTAQDRKLTAIIYYFYFIFSSSKGQPVSMHSAVATNLIAYEFSTFLRIKLQIALPIYTFTYLITSLTTQ